MPADGATLLSSLPGFNEFGNGSISPAAGPSTPLTGRKSISSKHTPQLLVKDRLHTHYFRSVVSYDYLLHDYEPCAFGRVKMSSRLKDVVAGEEGAVRK
jgi:hypothetical protein